MKHSNDPLLRFVEAFFREYLQRIRGASRHTVLAYGDTLRLFLSFVAERKKREVTALCLEDLTVERVVAFLDHLESTRHNSVPTRNLRLTALRSFFRHLLRQDPPNALQYQRVLSLPAKKASRPVITYLEPEEVRVLLQQPDRRTHRGFRDYALLLFLYNTGARISEALNVQRDDLQLIRPWQVCLHGKGRKDRIVPLWRDTAHALESLAERSELPQQNHVFRRLRGQTLSRDAVADLLEKYATTAAKRMPSIRKKHVTPHVLRHSCAVALLQGGVDLIVIRDYLGHESVETTGLYTRTNLRLKRKVLDAFWKRAGIQRPSSRRWCPKEDVLAFLTHL